ncbi:MAG: TlpA disulfide reductase family protein [Pseudomonadota bacterium]|nr:TlpA disulfide reductase family protein [Pseudomonadota bacterium]
MRVLKRWAGYAALAVLLLVLLRAMQPAPGIPLGTLAPDFTLRATDGTTIRLADLRGRPVVLNFWATWCPPCRVELPSFAAFSREHPEVTVLGIAVDSGTAATLAKARLELDIPYPVLLADPAVKSAYGIQAMPTTVVVGPEGQIVTTQTGVMFGWQLERALGL